MRYVYGLLGALLAGLGYLFGFVPGVIWSLLLAGAVVGYTVYHRMKPGLQTFDKAGWRIPAFILVGGLVVGLVLRIALFGTMNFYANNLSVM
ncbi:MAG: hypothetical protein AAGF32_10600 [Pseudomonadota bacterium]